MRVINLLAAARADPDTALLRPRASALLARQAFESALDAFWRAKGLSPFPVEEGVGCDPRFWRVARALTAPYPADTDDRRWVDGTLARKRGLGL